MIKRIVIILNKLLMNLVIGIIFLYQCFISPLLGVKCRYIPSCSEYSIESIKTHGLFKGMFFSIKRILSCHPFGRSGYDPIIKKAKNK